LTESLSSEHLFPGPHEHRRPSTDLQVIQDTWPEYTSTWYAEPIVP
jgi:hypothetical protein